VLSRVSSGSASSVTTGHPRCCARTSCATATSRPGRPPCCTARRLPAPVRCPEHRRRCTASRAGRPHPLGDQREPARPRKRVPRPGRPTRRSPRSRSSPGLRHTPRSRRGAQRFGGPDRTAVSDRALPTTLPSASVRSRRARVEAARDACSGSVDVVGGWACSYAEQSRRPPPLLLPPNPVSLRSQRAPQRASQRHTRPSAVARGSCPVGYATGAAVAGATLASPGTLLSVNGGFRAAARPGGHQVLLGAHRVCGCGGSGHVELSEL